MNNKNIVAAFITFLIALTIAWLAVGHTTEHIWSSWIFTTLLVIAIGILTAMLIARLHDETFDKLTFCVVLGIIIYGVFVNYEVDALHDFYKTPFNAVNILRFVITGAYGLFLIFTGVRWLQSRPF